MYVNTRRSLRLYPVSLVMRNGRRGARVLVGLNSAFVGTIKVELYHHAELPNTKPVSIGEFIQKTHEFCRPVMTTFV